jgi:DNA-directed RNA polymerase specialized sigma24 family protein
MGRMAKERTTCIGNQTGCAENLIVGIQHRERREPQAVAALVREAVLRHIEALKTDENIRTAHRGDHGSGPRAQGRDSMANTLQGFSRKQRETLVLFYVNGQSQRQISSELRIALEELQALNGRGNARLAELGGSHLSEHYLGGCSER